MKTTLIFPSYLHMAGFLSVAENANIQMDIRNRALTAAFSSADLRKAIELFKAQVTPAVSE